MPCARRLRCRPPHRPPRALQRCPPPPRLNLDGCKPVANTSADSSLRPAAAFVFTSSRIPRSNPPSTTVTPLTAPHSPASVSASSSSSAFHATPRPALSPSQLARHSLGALDARCVVGPSMRAAGFVPLSHNLTPFTHHRTQSSTASLASPDKTPATPSSTAGSAGIPTPSEPPPFPPIMFVNPTTTSMWEYQRSMGWGVASSKDRIGLGITAQATSASSSTLAHPSQNVLPASQQPIVPSLDPSSSSSTVLSSSSGSLSHANSFSAAPSASTSMTSIPSSQSVPSIRSSPENPQIKLASERAAKALCSGVDGYPFPHTPPRSRAHSNKTSDSSGSSTGISAYTTATEGHASSTSTASPSVQPFSDLASDAHTTTSRTPGPAAPSQLRISDDPPSSPKVRPSPVALQNVSTKPPSFSQAARLSREGLARADARQRPGALPTPPLPSPALSLTELCGSSPRAWLSDADVIGPMPTSSSRPVSPGSGSVSSSSSGRMSSRRSSRSSVGKSKRGEREKQEGDIVRETVISMEPLKEENTGEGSPTKHHGMSEKDREWERFKELDRKRRKDRKRKEEISTQEQDSAKPQSKEHPSPTRTRGHAMAHAIAYSSFSVPPGPSAVTANSRHHKDREGGHSDRREHGKSGSTSKERREREREHHREKDLDALVQAHRLHDREQARQSEREHRGRDPGREKEAKVDIADLDPSEWYKVCATIPSMHHRSNALSAASLAEDKGRPYLVNGEGGVDQRRRNDGPTGERCLIWPMSANKAVSVRCVPRNIPQSSYRPLLSVHRSRRFFAFNIVHHTHARKNDMISFS
ncbi:hypothetical protein K474DRAFT_557244 [Panus rudis PR-1116 ss-1]|nr:hypothetical protein K474DRAFT_557244 [Panus rudis PR-1116 ss-1]